MTIAPDLPTGRFGAIYADPPWRFRTYSARGKGRSAEAWYDCMDVAEIKALPVSGVAAPDCVLLMWVTDSFLAVGLEVMHAWGFAYKTVGFYWVKEQEGGARPIGNGYWSRANPEQCLLATRGHPRRTNADVRKLIVAPRREHSRKPDETYGRIERLCAGPYLELFARGRRPGWTAWGLEAEGGAAPPRRWRSDARDIAL